MFVIPYNILYITPTDRLSGFLLSSNEKTNAKHRIQLKYVSTYRTDTVLLQLNKRNS